MLNRVFFKSKGLLFCHEPALYSDSFVGYAFATVVADSFDELPSVSFFQKVPDFVASFFVSKGPDFQGFLL